MVPHHVLQIRSKTPTLVVFRVKKRETGKVNTTTKKERSSRTRDRPVVNNLTSVSYLEKDEQCTCLRGLWLRRSFCHYLSSLRSPPSQPKGSNLLVPCWSFHRDPWIYPMGLESILCGRRRSTRNCQRKHTKISPRSVPITLLELGLSVCRLILQLLQVLVGLHGLSPSLLLPPVVHSPPQTTSRRV